ncbi:MAG: hypothetical protein WC924_03745 [Candidatus Gracilibacteria bacterium]
MLGRKERFLKTFANLPLGVRKEIVLILDGKPISWDVAFIEIDNSTKISTTVLKKLEKLGII